MGPEHRLPAAAPAAGAVPNANAPGWPPHGSGCAPALRGRREGRPGHGSTSHRSTSAARSRRQRRAWG